MVITYNLTLNERKTIHSHALSLQEYDRELLDMDFRFGLNDFRAKLNSMGRLSEKDHDGIYQGFYCLLSYKGQFLYMAAIRYKMDVF